MGQVHARDVDGHFQQMFRDEHQGILAKHLGPFLRRLEQNFDNIAMLHIMERNYEGSLRFTAEYDGDKRITLTVSDPELFKKLEMGEFDKNGVMVKSPHSVVAEWRVQVKLPKG